MSRGEVEQGLYCVRYEFERINVSSILWHVDPLLGGDGEIGDCTAAVARHRPASNNKGKMFSTRSVPGCYKRDKLLVVTFYKCSINTITNPSSVYSHPYT
jgi:hypothetical protein